MKPRMQAMHQMLVRKGHAVHKTAKRPSRQQEKAQAKKEWK